MFKWNFRKSYTKIPISCLSVKVTYRTFSGVYQNISNYILYALNWNLGELLNYENFIVHFNFFENAAERVSFWNMSENNPVKFEKSS